MAAWAWLAALALALAAVRSGQAGKPETFEFIGRVELPPDVTDPHDTSRFYQLTRVVLDGDSFVAHLSSTGKFRFNNIPSASYTLEVYAPDHKYEVLRVDVSKKFQGDVRVVKYDAVNALAPEKRFYSPEHGLILKATMRTQYFMVREGYSIWGMLRNPMVLMMMLPLVMMYLMPKMMEGLDPAELEEMKKSQAAMTKAAGGSGGFDLAAQLAGMTSKQSEAAPPGKKRK